MITDEIVYIETRVWKQDHARGGAVCLFVCVEVLRPSQPSGVMSSVVSLSNHMFTGQA